SSTRQTMTITSNDKVIFKTIVSTGAKESPTPKGTFVIEPERGDFFYNASSKEGAYYWVSFKEHGIYLFHSVPTDQQGNEIPEEAKQLGKAASHGCVRMSRADAKWFYENIPQGTTVTIK
ncbi:L,D-transpeptidase, partial [Streptococcus agalactiae]|nr:L,D-transpeptidase [Streptococcus agalactiae]MCC9905776.1 L,D-transpeptidase [Streptococcus agalactiae]MCD0061021.1 L,D-transpeptidase [Streptococcus agalactiae]MCD0062538.1 L,D-transpeptidase [Streptococcus agalactiae]